MPFIIADIAYLLAVLLDLAALLLLVEWLVHSLPGAGLNPIRRFLFRATFPLLKLSDLFLRIEFGSFNSRGLLIGFVLLMVERFCVPLLVLLSYSLRG